MKLSAIAEQVGAKLVGNGDHEITGVNRIESAEAHELTFLANPQYRKHLETTRAGALILAEEAPTSAANLLIHRNPHYAFSRVVALFYPQPGSSLVAGVAPTAVVADSATLESDVHIGNHACIGEGSSVGQGSKLMAGCYVGDSCSIGEDCLIYPNVTIYDGTQIGDRVTIHAGTVVGSDGFGYAPQDGVHHKVLQVGTVRIEDDVEIGANCTIDRAALGETVIGAGSKIDNLVQIAHNVKLGRGCIIVSQVGISGSTRLGDYVTLAGQVGLVGHIEIGDGAIVGAQAGVPKSLAAKTIYAGSPARELMEFKRIEAHIHRLPQRMKQLQELEKRVADLRQQLESLEKSQQ